MFLFLCFILYLQFDLFQAFVRHPELAEAKHNRDYVLKQVCDAVNAISGVAQASGHSDSNHFEGAGELAAAMDEFDVRNIVILTLHQTSIFS